jgi:hypothetical protein
MLQQCLHGRNASRPHRAVQWRSASIVREVNDRSRLNEAIDDPHLVLRPPDTFRSWPRITDIVEGRSSPPVDRSWIRPSNEQKLDDPIIQRRCREVERRITDIEPVNAVDQTINRDGVSNQLPVALEDLEHR